MLEAYSPLGTGTPLANPTICAIAARLGRTTAHVLLRWCVQWGVLVVCKSMHRDRIEDNARIFAFSLSADDMARLDGLAVPDGRRPRSSDVVAAVS